MGITIKLRILDYFPGVLIFLLFRHKNMILMILKLAHLFFLVKSQKIKEKR